MLLNERTAIVYGGGGVVGGAVARAFAREGAHVHVTGPTRAKLDAVVTDVTAAGGRATAAVVDALDPAAVATHLDAVVRDDGGVDVSFNAMGRDEIEIGVPLVDQSPEDFARPIDTWTRTHFVTATAAGRHMAARGSGAILTLSSSVARMPEARAGGFLVACCAVEALSRQLAVELGPAGVRVICLRPDGILESARCGSITREVWTRAVGRMGLTLDQYLENPGGDTLLPHTVTLEEVGDVAAFMASDRASGMTATVANVSCGKLVDG